MCTSEYLSRFDTILVDTCTVLHDKFIGFLDSIEDRDPILTPKLIIPQCVLMELSKFENEESPRGEQTRSVQKALPIYQQKGVLKILDHPQKNFRPDEFFLSYAPHRQSERILFITQDYALCRDLVGMNRSASCYGYPVCVKRLSFYGTLQDFDMTRIPKAYTKLSDRTNAKAVFEQLIN